MNDQLRERHSIGFLSQRKEAKAEFKIHRRIFQASGVSRKEKKKRKHSEVITLIEHGINILRSLVQTSMVLWKFFRNFTN